MVSRKIVLLSLVPALLAVASSASTFAGENTPDQWDTNRGRSIPRRPRRKLVQVRLCEPRRGSIGEPRVSVATHFYPMHWRGPSCAGFRMRTSPTQWETKILEQTKSRVANWDQLDEVEFQLFYDFDEPKKKQSRGTEAVLNALLLSLDDRFQGRQQPSDDTKKSPGDTLGDTDYRGTAQGFLGMAQFRPRTLGVDGLTIPGRHDRGDRDRRGPGQRHCR